VITAILWPAAKWEARRVAGSHVNRKTATAIASNNKTKRPNAELRMPVQRVAGAKRDPA
jgi:hypothetical protein